jgi:peptidyl-prolyl cis-trans isomerase A (cyclophilin A)
MKRRLVILGGVVVMLVGVVVFTQWQPERLTAVTLEKAREVQIKLDQEAVSKTALGQPDARAEVAQAETKPAAAKPAEPAKPAKPDEAKPGDANVFKVRFECSNGTFVAECHRDWAPLGAARFEQLVKEGFYNDNRFFRVVPGFVVQFGLSGSAEVNRKWRTERIKDDSVKQSNVLGTLTFATSGPNTRTTQLFINLADNGGLDSKGFTPFGKVIEGMDVVKAITAQYGQRPNQQSIQEQGNAYLLKEFPKLDYIKTATIVP